MNDFNALVGCIATPHAGEAPLAPGATVVAFIVGLAVMLRAVKVGRGGRLPKGTKARMIRSAWRFAGVGG